MIFQLGMFTNIQIKAGRYENLTNRSCGGGVVLLVGEPALGGQLHGGLAPPRDLGLDERRLLLHLFNLTTDVSRLTRNFKSVAMWLEFITQNVYRVIHLLGENLLLTWIWDVLPSCLGSR